MSRTSQLRFLLLVLSIPFFLGAHTAGASSVDCSLRAPGANLSGCDLTGMNLAGIDLTGADLRNANLANADVSGTILANTQLGGLRSGGVVGVPSSLPVHWFVLSGYLLVRTRTRQAGS